MSNTALLQLGDAVPFELALLASDFVTIAVGLVIAYVAYRGYARNDSRPMLFIAAGFVLVFGGPGLVFLASLVVPMPNVVLGGLTQASELAGMVSILYGFLTPPGE